MEIPDPKVNVRPKFTKIFINNEWVNSVSGKTFATYSPMSEEKICDIQEGAKEDVDEAVKAARKAFGFDSEWRRMNASQRGSLINKLADLMERDRVFLASLETLDNGKPYALSYNLDLALSIDCYRYHAGWADKIHGKVVPIDGDFFAYTRYEPIGVCGQIVPWNVPLIMMAWKLAPALTCGNTVVLKPSELTSLTALHMCSLIKEAGFPPGVVNVVPGYGQTGKDISSHMDIDKVAFTGSLAVGRQVMEAAAKSNLKTCLLELGGKSPNIVFADADLDYAVDMAHQAVFFNQGQVCCSGTRTYVEESIYDDFVKKSVKKAKSRKLGDPWSLDTQQGSQINEKHMKKILGMIESGKKDGATLECGGAKWGGVEEKENKGFFVQPTVFSNVKDHMLIAREEIFGPVQQIIKFKDMDDVIKRANDTCYGLAAGVFTKDMDKAITVSHRLLAGSVWVNTYYAFSNKMPFGGYKRSGQGREMGEDGLKEYCNVKSIVTKIPKKIS